MLFKFFVLFQVVCEVMLPVFSLYKIKLTLNKAYISVETQNVENPEYGEPSIVNGEP